MLVVLLVLVSLILACVGKAVPYRPFIMFLSILDIIVFFGILLLFNDFVSTIYAVLAVKACEFFVVLSAAAEA